MPRTILNRRPSSRKVSPGLSSVPASMLPIITQHALAASAFTASPEYLMPPSATTGTAPPPRHPAALHQRARALARRHVADHELGVRERLAHPLRRLQHALGMAVRRV